MTSSGRHILFGLVITAMFACSTTASASVSLSFTNNGATPGSVTVSAGSSFPVQIKVIQHNRFHDGHGNFGRLLSAERRSAMFLKILSRNTQTDGSALRFYEFL